MDDNSVKTEDSSAARLDFHIGEDSMSALVSLGGDWSIGQRADGLRQFLVRVEYGQIRKVSFNCDNLGRWDSSLIVFIRKLIRLNDTGQLDVDFEGLPDGLIALEEMARSGSAEMVKPNPPKHLYDRVGEQVVSSLNKCFDALGFLGELTISVGKLFIARSRMRKKDFVAAMHLCGPDSLAIVMMISMLVGLVVSFIGALQLKMFGAEIFVADLVVIAMLREMGPIMTSIIVAGRVGASFAATLGTMKVNQEVDALLTLGISPVDFLALPRVLAMTLMLPLLVMFSDFTGVLGGSLAGGLLLDISFAEYYSRAANSYGGVNNLLIGLVKAVAFGAVISISACRRGLRCSGSSSEVGRATTMAVVDAIVWIVIVDSVAAVVCQYIGY